MIDCDIHNQLPSLETLVPYLEEHWRAYLRESAFVGPDVNDYPEGTSIPARPGTTPPSGGPPGSDPEFLCAQTLDAWDLELGILNCNYWVQSVHNEYLASALATAINTWQVEHWLTADPRLRASLVVPSQNPVLAAQEIDRLGDHPGFVQVILPVRSWTPYGNRRFDPLYEAVLRHDLAVGIHFGGSSGNPPTPCGWPSTYLEEYAGMSQVFQSQILSLIAEGTFDRYPQLRVALIEGGFTWMPSLMWRLDKEWRGLRRDIPWVKRPPSEYIREHIRLTLQPVDAPPRTRQLLEVLEQMDGQDLLMFSSDYPHCHDGAVEETLPVQLPDSLWDRIGSENAREFYRL